jgi:hypothetical protein
MHKQEIQEIMMWRNFVSIFMLEKEKNSSFEFHDFYWTKVTFPFHF